MKVDCEICQYKWFIFLFSAGEKSRWALVSGESKNKKLQNRAERVATRLANTLFIIHVLE